MLGTWLGHFDIIARNIDAIVVAMVLVSVVPGVVQLLKRRRNSRRAAAAADKAAGDTAEEPGAGLRTEEMAAEE